MRVYPILGCNSLLNQNNTSTSFKGIIPHKEIKNIGTDYIKRSESANDRNEVYDIASKYFYEGILPIIEKENLCKITSFDLFRQEIINAAASKVELEFNPDFINFKKNSERYSLNKEKNTFKNFVGSINTIAKNWEHLIEKDKK